MSAFETVIYEKEDGVARVTLNRPTVLNVYNIRMRDELYQVLRAIKEKWPESEVVIVTGYPTIESAKEAVKLGAYDYLSKPVTPDTMVRTTTSAMMKKRWSLQEYQPPEHEEDRLGYRFPWEV